MVRVAAAAATGTNSAPFAQLSFCQGAPHTGAPSSNIPMICCLDRVCSNIHIPVAADAKGLYS
jgi:hypothetical protein